MSQDKKALEGLKIEEKDFLDLLTQVIGHTKELQNQPPNLVPKEELVADIVVKYLAPYSGENGPLKVKKINYTANRSNVIITYPGTHPTKVVSFVGCHMDVVPANPEEWQHNPFKLERGSSPEEDKVYGRGVTDCLGHVAMFTNFFKCLAVAKPKLETTVAAVFIANEESSAIQGVGIDELEKQGELKFLKHGPLYWVDSANFGPTLGTGGMCAWEITVNGKKFHSGFPHKGINAVELAMAVVHHIQERFYADFHAYDAEEKKYLFEIGSSFKPTQIVTGPGSINQIPGLCTVSGDIRHTPFYSTQFVKEKLEKYMKELDVTTLPTRGHSRYTLPNEQLKGTVELKWLGQAYPGVAVNMESVGYKAIFKAVDVVCGGAKPFSLTGSLPIIRDLADAGYDVQITGFGRLDAYHANNEFAYLSDYAKGFNVCAHIIQYLEYGL